MKRSIALACSLAALALLAPQTLAAAPGSSVVVKGSKQVRKLPPSVAGEAAVTETSVVSSATRVSVARLGTDANLVSANGVTLSAAAAAATVYFRTWRQWTESLLWGIPWREEHRGGYYWDGTRVWLKARLGWDTGGYHRCGYNSGIGFTVSVESCWKTGDPSTSRMTNGDQFKVSALFKGFPISATHEMRLCMNPTGGYWSC